MRGRPARRRTPAAACLSLLLAACAGPADRPPPPGPPAFGTLVPDVAVLAPGDRLTLDATFEDSAGTVLTGVTPRLVVEGAGLALDGPAAVVAHRVGDAIVRATLGKVTLTGRIRVVPPDPEGPVIDVFPAQEHQRIRAWEGSAQLGEVDCDTAAFRIVQPQLADRLVNELGLTRLRVSLRSGIEQPVDQWPRFRDGTLTFPVWRRTWMVAENDNADPFVADPARFQWGFMDYQLDTVLVPIRRAMQARGESLSVNLNYVDFYLGAGRKAFPQMKQPEEYAEFIRVAFDHLSARYGQAPDALELNLEPENTPYDGTDMGRALVAVAARLRAGGYTPTFIGPSTTNAANAIRYYDDMVRVPGARGLVGELSYHKYSGVSAATLRAIGRRARRDGIAAAMLEHIGSGFDGLYDDLTLANASSWGQFTLASCGRTDNPANGGVYYQVNVADPRHPRVHLTHDGRLLAQVFRHVRPGAVRLGATSSTGAWRPLAFRNRDGHVAVVVQAPHAGAFGLRGVPPGDYRVTWATRTGAYNVPLPDVTVGTAPVRVSVPEAGVVTLVGR